MVRRIDVGADGEVAVTVTLTTAGCPIRGHFQSAVRDAVISLDGVRSVSIDFDVMDEQQKATLRQTLGRSELPEGALALVENVICVGSGKGGVGKSTLTANLAAALQAEGRRVGVLDADVWGYSIPRMLGLGAERPEVSAERKILPLDASGISVMSIGFFVEEDAGDVSMTLAQLLPQATFVIVTTPQPAAQRVARRAAEMAHKVSLEVSGVIENMAGFVTPDGERYAIFGEGGGQALADELDVPLLGRVPLTMPLRAASDAGVPLVVEDPDDPASQAIRHAARGLIALAPPPRPRATAPVGIALPMAG